MLIILSLWLILVLPLRLLWPNWETFITHSKNGNLVPDEELPVAPQWKLGNVSTGSVGDYLGLPTGVPSEDGSEISLFRLIVWLG